MKKIFITILLLSLTGCSSSNYFGGVDNKDENIETEKEIIKIQKKIEKEKDGKYKQIKPYEKNGIIYKVDEYFRPDKTIGYQIIIETKEYVESIATGSEYISRTWKKYKNSTSTLE